MTDFKRMVGVFERKTDGLRRDEKNAIAEHNIAHEAVQEARARMDEYAQKMRTLEIDLLRELVEKELSRADFTEFEAKLKEAAERAVELADAHDEALKNLKKTERAVERAREETLKSQSRLNRISEMETLLDQERQADEIRAQDEAIDAFVETMGVRAGGLV